MEARGTDDGGGPAGVTGAGLTSFVLLVVVAVVGGSETGMASEAATGADPPNTNAGAGAGGAADRGAEVGGAPAFITALLHTTISKTLPSASHHCMRATHSDTLGRADKCFADCVV